MLRKIEEQNKTIEYIKKAYKEKTGQDVMMPMKWEDYLEMPEEEVPSLPLPIFTIDQEELKSFRLAIDKLNLPSRINASKLPLTSFDATNRFHMTQIIDLSGYLHYGFSKVLFREFLSRIVDMRALHAISLRKNGIDDSCVEEVETLLGMKRITRIDLSSNKMQKTCLQIINKNFSHLEWVDLSRNYFAFEAASLQTLLNAVRSNSKLWHLCLDLQQPKLVQYFCGLLKMKPQLHSLGLICCKVEMESMNFICKALEEAGGKKDLDRRINYLDFSYCYLERKVFELLMDSITVNNTLITLNLSHNNLGNGPGCRLCRVIQSNLSLNNVNVAGNLLDDEFAVELSICLEKNEIIQVIDISQNRIGSEGGKAIYDILSTKNDILESLGQFDTNERMGPELMQKIKKALKINKVSKDIRSKIMAQDTNLNAVQISNRQTEAYLEAEYQDFQLLVPISVSNPLVNQRNQMHVWDLPDFP